MRLIELGLTPDQIMTAAAFDNALRVLQAIGGSTNGIIHLTAIAGRLGIKLEPDRLDQLGGDHPDAGRPQADRRRATWRISTAPAACVWCCRRLKPLLHLDALTVTGQTLA